MGLLYNLAFKSGWALNDVLRAAANLGSCKKGQDRDSVRGDVAKNSPPPHVSLGD